MVNPSSKKPTYTKTKEIIGKNIILEKTSIKQAKQLYKLIKNKGVLKYLTVIINDFKDLLDYLRFTENQWQMNEDFTYTIKKNDSTIIGQISLYNVNFIHYRAEVGIWIGIPYQNMGYGTTALTLIKKYAFENLNMNRLQAHMFISNPNSQKLFERVGFKKEGLHFQYVRKNDDYIDVYCYACINNRQKIHTQ